MRNVHALASLYVLSALLVVSARDVPPAQVISEKTHATLELTVTEGQEKRPIALTAKQPITLSTAAAGDYRAAAEQIKIRGKITPANEESLASWQVEFHNEGKERRLLEICLEWTLQKISQDAKYWGGGYGEQGERMVVDLPDKQHSENVRRISPWSAYAAQDYAVALGLHPLDLRSYLANHWQRGTEPGEGAISVVTRIVLEPNQTIPVNFLFGEFPVEYELERELIQRVHNTTPTAFSPHPQAHPSLYGISAQYYSSRINPKTLPAGALLEFLRRHFVTWDWDYAPFKRAGDHWGHKETWDYTPLIPFDKAVRAGLQTKLDFSKINREQFLKLREQHFNHDKGRAGRYFFTPGGTWMEKQMADKWHPDARTIDKNSQYERKRWVTGYDTEVKILPWFTSVQKGLTADWNRIAKSYDIYGVALDVCRGGPRYRGPAIESPIEYRAWDENGIFIDQGIGIAKYIEFLHSLHPRQSPQHVMAIYGNPEVGGASFMTAARYDGGMFEGPPYHPNNKGLFLHRYLTGQKPIVWWGGWQYDRYAVPNYLAFDKEHFVETMHGLVDYTIFKSFELAVLPDLLHELGVPQIRVIIPDLIDAIRLGWQAVFPVNYTWKGQLHTARYGTDSNTLLFYGNPYEKERPFQARVNNRRLCSDGNLVFASWREQSHSLHNVIKGSETILDFTLASRKPVLHRAIAKITGTQNLAVAAEVTRDHYQITESLKFEHAVTEKLNISIPQFHDYKFVEAKLNGNPIATDIQDHQIHLATLNDIKANSELTIHYRAKWLNLTRQQVRNFQLLNDKGAITFQVTTAGEIEKTEMAVEKVRQYLALYRFENWKIKDTVLPNQAKRELILQVIPSGKNIGVTAPTPSKIIVAGHSAEELEQALNYLLAAFDEFYPYTSKFRATWGMPSPVLRHAGLLHQSLPDR